MSGGQLEFFATCATGLEAVLGDELRRIGVHGVRPLRGGVSFSGGLGDAYRALLWSRVASRVLLTLARVDAGSADALYGGVRGIAWQQHLRPGGTLAVSARGANDALRSPQFTALKVKDAICDALREACGQRPDVDVQGPDVRVNVVVSGQRATISLDLSGEGLEHRGYRAGKPCGAPLSENLAAALLLLAGWQGKPGQGLANPTCGSGALAVEAALMAADVAPGILRPRWGFTGWAGHDEALWGKLLGEADARAEAGVAHAGAVPVIASDADASCVAYTRACAKRAGVERGITFTAPGEGPTLASLQVSEGLLACAVPSGQQLAAAQLPAFFAQLQQRAAADAGVGGMALALPEGALALASAQAPACRVPVRNGARAAELCAWPSMRRQPAVQVQVRGRSMAVADGAAQQFAARLAKVGKQRRKWARQQGVAAWRVYDADLPDYKLAIDVYQGAGPDEGAVKVHVAEYAAPKEVSPEKAARRVADALRIIPAALDVAPEDVYLKRRMRAKGGSQYSAASAGAQPQPFITQEGGLLLEVDLASYLDTGLFLDHRETRRLIGQAARGKSFLNLFAYTGAASAHAAAGGAKFTTTVDLSNTYLQWAQRNMQLNGLLNEHQHFERADVLAWVAEKRHTKERWDLVFCDVPTFSNSTKMGGRSWDVQRDHAELLIGVSRLLTRGGAALFSCNRRTFKPDVETLAKAGVALADVTPKTIPPDFERTPHVHRCYLLKRS